MRRTLLALTLGIAVTAGTVVPAAAQQEHRPFTVNGTFLQIEGTLAELVTADITGQEKIVWVDVSQLRDLDSGRIANLKDFEAVQIMLLEQPDSTFLAIEYRELAKGSMVNNTDWGVSEAYTTRDDSINARVDNGPDDDEARAQGNTFDVKGRRVEEDDD